MLLSFGLGAAVTSCIIAYHSFSAVMTADEWEIVRTLMRTGRRSLPPSMLWAQHNEHRIVLGRLATLADMSLFGGRGISLVIESFLTQILSALLFILVFWRFRRTSKVVLISVAGFTIFCMLCPLQMENFLWHFQITFVAAEFAAATAFGCLTLYPASVKAGRTWFSWGLLSGSLVAGAVGTLSIADGLLVWPILVLLAAAMALPRRIQLLIAGFSVALVGLYLIGYHHPPYPTSQYSKVLHPLRILKYVVTYFGSSWDASLPSSGNFPAFSEIMTLVAIAVSIGNATAAFWRARTIVDPLRVFLGACSLFTIGAALLTSIARLDLGVVQATTSRYQVVALLFWASFGILVFSYVSRERIGGAQMLTVQVVVLALIISNRGRYDGIARGADQRRVTLSRAYAALAYGPDEVPDLDALRPLYPVPELVPGWYAFLRANNIGPDASEYVSKQARLIKTIRGWGGYQMVASTNCMGVLDGYQRLTSRRALVRGWAWDVQAKRPPARIILALPDGLITGFAEVDTPRPEVKALLKIPDLVTGWDGEALVSRRSRLRAFAVVGDSKSICQLGDGLDIP
jgi:hypothetical protein